MVKVPFVPSAFSSKDHGHLKIARWLQMLKIDAVRLQHFEKDALGLVIAAIRDVPDETPSVAGPRAPDPERLPQLQ